MLPSDEILESPALAAEELRLWAEPLLRAPALVRLAGVGFLGVLAPQVKRGVADDDAWLEAGERSDGSRLDHSIGVAWLALAAARRLDLSPLACRYAVAWGLTHDIATWALSHTSEPAFTRINGVSARELRREMILGCRRLPRTLHVRQQLREMGVDPETLASLFLRSRPENVELWFLSQVIHSLLTPDTLEGMWRSARVFGVPSISPLRIVMSLHRDLVEVGLDRKGFDAAKQFWLHKGSLYRAHINDTDSIQHESRWCVAIEHTFRDTALVDSLELDDAAVLRRVRQFELPHVESIRRYKPPQTYVVSKSGHRDAEGVMLGALKQVFLKLPASRVSGDGAARSSKAVGEPTRL